MELAATITIDPPDEVESLVAALHRGGCTSVYANDSSVEFAFPWGSPETDGTLIEAWQEVVFFVRAWEMDHTAVEAEIEDVRFVPSVDTLAQQRAA